MKGRMAMNTSSRRQGNQAQHMMGVDRIRRRSGAAALMIYGVAQLTLDYYATAPLMQPGLAIPSPTTTSKATTTPAVPATFLGLDVGDWASWGVALFTLLSFGVIALGLYVERNNRRKDLKTEAARRTEDLLRESTNRADDLRRERENREWDIKRVQERQEKLDNRQNELDEQAAYLLESEQARHVGAFISWPSDAEPSEDQDVVEMTIVNASVLPISNIRGYVISFNDHRTVSAFPQIVVIYPYQDKPDKQRAYVGQTTSRNDLRLVLVFDDDSGVRWRKYLDYPSPHKLEDRTVDLPW
jgi:hypothetical protein